MWSFSIWRPVSLQFRKYNKENQKRPRKTNWCDSEITVLTEKVEENLGLIRFKFSNNVTNAKKNAAWLEITGAVNAVGVAYRAVQEVRDKWKSLTSTAKKEKPVEVRPPKSHQMRRLRSSRYLKKHHRSLAFQAVRQIQVSLSLKFCSLFCFHWELIHVVKRPSSNFWC